MIGRRIAALALAMVAMLAPAAITLLGVPVELSSFGATMFAFGVTLAVAGLVALAVGAAGRSIPACSLAALPYASFTSWHLRETFGWPASPALLLLLLLGTAATVVGIGRAFAPLRRPMRLIGAGLAATAAGGLFFCGWAAKSEYGRWLVTHHTRSVGYPVKVLLGIDPRKADARRVPEPRPFEPTLAPARPLAVGTAEQANIVVVLVDTLRADAIPPWRASADDLPEFGRLAESSLVFSDVRANSSWTRPSVASLFTGLLPEEHGARTKRDALDPRHSALAERFRDLGYRTVAFVTNFAVVGVHAGFDQGFDEFHELEAAPYLPAGRVRETISVWADRSRSERPTFLYVHLLDPHMPYLSGGARPEDRRRPGVHRSGYEREVRYLDGELAGLLSTIEQLNSRPTWTLLTSDHGEEFGEHGLLGHGYDLYRETLHVPALLRGPTRTAGHIDTPLELRDFYDLLPRLCDPGFNATAWARHRRREVRLSSLRRELWAPAHRWYVGFISAQRLELASGEVVVWSANGDARELYDARFDPGELRNRSRESPERLGELDRMLRSLLPVPVAAPSADSSEEAEKQFLALGYIG